jgi:hypothetical protein
MYTWRNKSTPRRQSGGSIGCGKGSTPFCSNREGVGISELLSTKHQPRPINHDTPFSRTVQAHHQPVLVFFDQFVVSYDTCQNTLDDKIDILDIQLNNLDRFEQSIVSVSEYETEHERERERETEHEREREREQERECVCVFDERAHTFPLRIKISFLNHITSVTSAFLLIPRWWWVSSTVATKAAGSMTETLLQRFSVLYPTLYDRALRVASDERSKAPSRFVASRKYSTNENGWAIRTSTRPNVVTLVAADVRIELRRATVGKSLEQYHQNDPQNQGA